MKQMWDERYSGEEYAYGEEPNEFLKAQLSGLKPGKILFPAEGEGRNAVYAATRGWEAYAFDQSAEGKKKAERLAAKQNVKIHYSVCGLEEAVYEENTFDAVCLIFAHFPPEKRNAYHLSLSRFLKKDGIVLLEGFSKKHFQYRLNNPSAGGPGDINMLFSMDEIKNDFQVFEIIDLQETDTILHEGKGHNGLASVVRFIGKKITPFH